MGLNGKIQTGSRESAMLAYITNYLELYGQNNLMTQSDGTFGHCKTLFILIQFFFQSVLCWSWNYVKIKKEKVQNSETVCHLFCFTAVFVMFAFQSVAYWSSNCTKTRLNVCVRAQNCVICNLRYTFECLFFVGFLFFIFLKFVLCFMFVFVLFYICLWINFLDLSWERVCIWEVF